MVEQNARRCLQICDRGYVLDQGKDSHTGTGHELADDPKVIELYLGTLADDVDAAASSYGRELATARGTSRAVRRGPRVGWCERARDRRHDPKSERLPEVNRADVGGYDRIELHRVESRPSVAASMHVLGERATDSPTGCPRIDHEARVRDVRSAAGLVRVHFRRCRGCCRRHPRRRKPGRAARASTRSAPRSSVVSVGQQ